MAAPRFGGHPLGVPAALWRTAAAWLGLACLVWLAASPDARAHFKLDIAIRVFHVEHLEDALRVYLRLPMALLVADRVGPERADGTRVPAPYTTNGLEGGQLMHRVDVAALEADPLGLGQLVAEGHVFAVDGHVLPATVEKVRAYPAALQPKFATLEEARTALVGPPYPPGAEATYVGDTVVDAVLRLDAGGPVSRYTVAGRLHPGLPGEADLANLIIDYLGGDTLILRQRGLLLEPVAVSRSMLAAAGTFVVEGMRHILEGMDHVLFVLCMAVGALGLSQLLWRVSGFTLGHTVTLIAGFFGLAPSGAWFVPAIESAIALSIIYAGAVALIGTDRGRTAVVTFSIGLLHGLGFSFVLHEILKVEAPNLWVSLLSFNVGVELGQLAIVLLVWPPIWALGRRRPVTGGYLRAAIAVPCIAVAAVWSGERLMTLAQQALT
jgi:hypothetical protein